MGTTTQNQRIAMERHLEQFPDAVRPLVEEARALVRSVAPQAEEVAYQSSRPSSKSFIWKLARYRAGREYVAGIGAFSDHANLFFYRGRELSDQAGLLGGRGKDTRFVSLRTLNDARSGQLELLLRQAFALAELK